MVLIQDDSNGAETNVVTIRGSSQLSVKNQIWKAIISEDEI